MYICVWTDVAQAQKLLDYSEDLAKMKTDRYKVACQHAFLPVTDI